MTLIIASTIPFAGMYLEGITANTSDTSAITANTLPQNVKCNSAHDEAPTTAELSICAKHDTAKKKITDKRNNCFFMFVFF